MVEPTLEDDIASLRAFVEAYAGSQEQEANRLAALDRVSAAVRDRAHLGVKKAWRKS